MMPNVSIAENGLYDAFTTATVTYCYTALKSRQLTFKGCLTHCANKQQA